jgi:hypothetical protein
VDHFTLDIDQADEFLAEKFHKSGALGMMDSVTALCHVLTCIEDGKRTRGSKSLLLYDTITLNLWHSHSYFVGELCQKGYGRMNEFDAHESSYDHQHKKVRGNSLYD